MRFVPVVLVAASLAGCNPKPLEPAQKSDAGAPAAGLTEEQAAKVLARVGDRSITLGDYAATLERMNEFDRMRYQSPEKRRELLQEMIDLELLGGEAKKRGLDKTPEAEELTRQILRDAMLVEARRGLPAPQEIPLVEVRAWYDAHLADFREPERRRVSAIVLKDKKEAEKVLLDAKKTSPMEWGKLVQKYAETPIKTGPTMPLESLGDLGIVGPPSDDKGDSARVPPEVRAAVFEIQGEPPAVLDRVVAASDRFFLVRLVGKTPAHERSFAESERSIRGILVQEKMEQRAHALEDELKKQFPVTIDDVALAEVRVPNGALSAPPLAPLPPNAPPAPSTSAPKR